MLVFERETRLEQLRGKTGENQISLFPVFAGGSSLNSSSARAGLRKTMSDNHDDGNEVDGQDDPVQEQTGQGVKGHLPPYTVLVTAVAVQMFILFGLWLMFHNNVDSHEPDSVTAATIFMFLYGLFGGILMTVLLLIGIVNALRSDGRKAGTTKQALTYVLIVVAGVCVAFNCLALLAPQSVLSVFG